ncbi:MAG TPA: hypothetical protein VMB52_03100 [Verrucomicrobiae bacterium]|nr:hypothetical protein [Verrucomicrobiae bacterium]
MLGRKAKQQPQENPRRQVQRNSGISPAFSYYTSRISEGPPERPKVDKKHGQRPVADDVADVKLKRRSHSVLAGIPFWLLLIVIVVCVGKLLMLSTDPKIVVVGETTTSASYLQPNTVYEAALQRLLSGSIMNRSKLTVDTEGISQAFEAQFPELQDVSISVPLASSRPVVYIQPALPSLVLQSTQGSYYALNASGLVLTTLHGQITGVPLVIDQSGLRPKVGRQVVPSSTVGFAQTVLYQLNAAHITTSSFVLPASAPYELDVHLAGKSYLVRFNLEEDPLTQSGAAIATIQQLGSTTPSSYIDVRVPGRVYYK